MKPVTMKSIYGKTLAFKDYSLGDRAGRIEVVYRDDDGNHKGGMVFDKCHVDALRTALALPVTEKPDEGVFFLLRQRIGDPLKVKACFAGVTTTKEYTSRSAAQQAAKHQNNQHGSKWNYFVVEKETV